MAKLPTALDRCAADPLTDSLPWGTNSASAHQAGTYRDAEGATVVWVGHGADAGQGESGPVDFDTHLAGPDSELPMDKHERRKSKEDGWVDTKYYSRLGGSPNTL